jgi:hypothetical protein
LSGYTSARYTVRNKICYFVFDAENKNLSGGSGTIGITLPIAVGASTGYFVLNTDINDGSAWVGKVHANIGASTTIMGIYKTAAAGAWVGNETGVSLRISGFYEVD